jgi:hypothetical protein
MTECDMSYGMPSDTMNGIDEEPFQIWWMNTSLEILSHFCELVNGCELHNLSCKC